MGTWIEIQPLDRRKRERNCRSLQWERGLKFFSLFANMFRTVSFPAMGTWIEILLRLIFHEFMRRSLQWERGLKCSIISITDSYFRRSLQWERGLKFLRPGALCYFLGVVPCNGNVDWNPLWSAVSTDYLRSFPAMGTWIEIRYNPPLSSCSQEVVPCNGNVDWNNPSAVTSTVSYSRSLQWERGLKSQRDTGIIVNYRRSLQWERGLKFQADIPYHDISCRSLQWERGLKYFFYTPLKTPWPSFPAMGTWIEMQK